MPNMIQPASRPSLTSFIKWREILSWMESHAAILSAVILSLSIGAYFLGHHLLDNTIPTDGDVRSHVFKIELLQSYLTHFSWPQWNPYWYHGIPEDQFYPPGFYFLGALLAFVTNGVIAYKILLFLTMALNGLAIYYFSKRFLKFGSHLAIWCLVAFQTATPLLVNFLYGEGPNMLGWSITVAFLTLYLSQLMENNTRGLVKIFFPGLILGVAILIHPFPVIFAVMAVIIFHAVWLVHKRDWHTFWHDQIPYAVAIFLIGGLIGIYYWLPALLTLHYSSPIYSFTQFMWPGGNIYLLAIIFLALAVTAATRTKIRGDVNFDTVIICFCLASALGYGATRFLPFGFGSLVQEFRFAAIIVPFFGILLIVHPLKYKLLKLKLEPLAAALVTATFLTVFIFGLDKRDAFASGFKAITNPGLGSLYQLVSKQFSPGFPLFAVTLFPYFAVITFLAFSLNSRAPIIKKSKPVYVISVGVCLLLLTSFIPYINTEKQVGLGRLTNTIDYYEQPAYAQIMGAASGGRMIVPPGKGALISGDSPVTFGWKWGVQTVNGPYNQGDPKFFQITVHLEWEERWLNYVAPRENLMQESAAKYIFIRDNYALPSNLTGVSTMVSNSYGKLLSLDENVAFANRVTPVLIDVAKPREVTEFFNILLPSGYKWVLVDVHDVPDDLISKFSYVMLDDSSRISAYPGKTVFLLNNSISPSVLEDRGVIRLDLPYLTYTNRIFYHGDEANGYMWTGWDAWPGARITSDIQDGVDAVSKLLSPYLAKLTYSGAGYRAADTRIEISTSPGFTLVKDSYFPYWQSPQGPIISTSQGFMLIHSDSDSIVLTYRRPLYYILAAAISVLVLLAVVTLLLVVAFSRKASSNSHRKASS